MHDVKHRSSALEDGQAGEVSDDGTDLAELAEQAEAELHAAEAIAAAARARVQELRRSAAEAESEAVEPTQTAETKRRRWHRPRPKTVLVGFAVVLTCTLLAASGYMVWHHRQVGEEQQRRAEFAAAARQAVVTLMSIDAGKAQDGVQRIIDNSTGQFRDDFQNSAKDFVDVAKQSNSVTTATVKASAVESMTRDSAVVLVTAATTISNNAGANQQPRTWRLSVDVTRDGGRIKMSKVDFVP